MFNSCNSLTDLDLSSFDTSNVTDMNYMFSSCRMLANITYGDNFIHKENANIGDMYYTCPANKPTHESWNGLFT